MGKVRVSLEKRKKSQKENSESQWKRGRPAYGKSASRSLNVAGTGLAEDARSAPATGVSSQRPCLLAKNRIDLPCPPSADKVNQFCSIGFARVGVAVLQDELCPFATLHLTEIILPLKKSTRFPGRNSTSMSGHSASLEVPTLRVSRARKHSIVTALLTSSLVRFTLRSLGCFASHSLALVALPSLLRFMPAHRS